MELLSFLKDVSDPIKRRKKLLIVVPLAFAVLFPFVPGFEGYITHIGVLVLLNILLALGLNVVPGFTGFLDLGYVGFYGIGAYTCGLLTLNYDLIFWVVLPIAAANGALWGVFRGAPTLRLSGDYFAIVTFGFSELVVLTIINETWLTRGPMGLPGIAPPSLFGREFSEEMSFYYLALTLVILTVIVMSRLQNSRVGRAWSAIREDEIAAQSCGVNVMRYKVAAFAVSAAFAAVGGAFFARWITFISPNMFKFWESVMILCMVVLGGMGSVPGTVIGTIILGSLSEILRGILPESGILERARFLFFGLIMVLLMRFRPEGLCPVRGHFSPDQKL